MTSEQLKGYVSFRKTVSGPNGSYSSRSVEMGQEFTVGVITHEAQLAALKELVDQALPDSTNGAAAEPTPKPATGTASQPTSTKTPAPGPTTTKPTDDAKVAAALDSLIWKSMKNGGHWTFATNQDGSLVNQLKPLTEFVAAVQKGTVNLRGFDYKISADSKFLNRFPEGSR